jgi:epoxyqueuosine reductase
MLTSLLFSSDIIDKAWNLGFDACGIAKVEKLPEETAYFKNWLQKGLHGSMKYLEDHLEKREDPSILFPGAKSIIVVLVNYYTSETQIDPKAPVLSKYAYGKDYHKTIRKKLQLLLNYLQEIYPTLEGKMAVDTVPFFDKVWAVKAGLGWIGKNTNVISPQLGSFVFIGSLIINVTVDYPVQLVKDYCGDCNRCIQACPTGALEAPGVLNARKCISYQTIENKADIIPEEFAGRFQNRVFGCDICQDVCPWNKRARQHQTEELEPYKKVMNMKAEDWYNLSESEYDAIFKGSAVKRAKYKGIMRNLQFLKSSKNHSE